MGLSLSFDGRRESARRAVGQRLRSRELRASGVVRVSES